MRRTIYEPIVTDIDKERRKQIQNEFGRHLVENRNRMANLVRKWIESDVTFPIPVYDRLLRRLRHLDSSTRQDVASVCLLMADQVVSGILGTFDKGDDMRTATSLVNYAIVAQIRGSGIDSQVETVDVNCGKPVMAVWDRYKKWLSRFAPSELRASSKTR